ncbi:MAG: hypothetical protein AAGF12_19495 [Myxococcota bacterium]
MHWRIVGLVLIAGACGAPASTTAPPRATAEEPPPPEVAPEPRVEPRTPFRAVMPESYTSLMYADFETIRQTAALQAVYTDLVEWVASSRPDLNALTRSAVLNPFEHGREVALSSPVRQWTWAFTVSYGERPERLAEAGRTLSDDARDEGRLSYRRVPGVRDHVPWLAHLGDRRVLVATEDALESAASAPEREVPFLEPGDLALWHTTEFDRTRFRRAEAPGELLARLRLAERGNLMLILLGSYPTDEDAGRAFAQLSSLWAEVSGSFAASMFVIPQTARLQRDGRQIRFEVQFTGAQAGAMSHVVFSGMGVPDFEPEAP